MVIVIQLICRFLHVYEVIHLCEILNLNSQLKYEIMTSYFYETMYLSERDKICLASIDDIPQELYNRIYHPEYVIERILNHELLDFITKMKLYHGIRYQMPQYVDMYREYFYILFGEYRTFNINANRIVSLLPVTTGKYDIIVNEYGEILLFYRGMVVGRNFSSNVFKIIDQYHEEYIEILLQSELFLENLKLYNNKCEGTKMHMARNECRRPKVRRRFLVE